MKSYDEIAEKILEKYNSRIAEKKRRRGIIMRTAGSVSGVCAAVIVGVAVWHNTTLRDASRVLYQPQKSNVIVVEGTTADSGNADVGEEAAAAPQTVPVQAAEMTAAQTTVTAADAPAVPTMTAAVNDAPLQTAPAQTAPISTAVTVQAVTTVQTAPAAPQTTATAAQITQTITAAQPQQTTQYITPTEAPPTTTTAVKWEDLPIYEQYSTFEHEDISEDSQHIKYSFNTNGEKISSDYLYEYNRTIVLTSHDTNDSGDTILHTISAELWIIKYNAFNEEVAVKFEGTDDYYIYYGTPIEESNSLSDETAKGGDS